VTPKAEKKGMNARGSRKKEAKVRRRIHVCVCHMRRRIHVCHLRNARGSRKKEAKVPHSE
jgi:hypothetical protein